MRAAVTSSGGDTTARADTPRGMGSPDPTPGGPRLAWAGQLVGGRLVWIAEASTGLRATLCERCAGAGMLACEWCAPTPCQDCPDCLGLGYIGGRA